MKWVLAIWLLCGAVATAATLHVRVSATGAAGAHNGTDWTDALVYTNLPATLVRGNTYYVADGFYPTYTFDDADDGQLITIKKATVADHGSETGWDNSYGDGQAIWNYRWAIETHNYFFDGQTGGMTTNWETYGFKVLHTNYIVNNQYTLYIRNSGTTAATNLAFNHVLFSFAPVSYEQGTSNYNCHHTMIYGGARDIQWTNCAFAFTPQTCIKTAYSDGWSVTNLVLDRCLFYAINMYNDYGGFSNHGETFALDSVYGVKVLRSLFWNNTGSGVFVALNVATPREVSDVDFFNNVVFNDDVARGFGSSYTGTDGAICVLNLVEANRWRVIGNSFVNLVPNGAANMGIRFDQSTCDAGGGNHVVRNNLWFSDRTPAGNVNVTWVAGDANSTSDYNRYVDMGTTPTEANGTTGTGDPFTDYANRDFSLTAATPAGQTQSAPFNIDYAGNTRGGDGVWDIGAYEFGGTPAVPAAPGNLRATRLNAGRIVGR